MDIQHQHYPAPMPHQGHIQQQLPQDIQAKLGLIQQGKISAIKEQINQFPNDENNMTAVCTTTIQTDMVSIEQFGICTPDDIGGSQYPANLLESASKFATEKALALALAASSQASPQVIDVPATKNKSSYRGKPRNDYGHLAHMPATEKQNNLLRRMAAESGVDIETTCQNILNKSFDSLNNSDVQQLVEFFKKR